MVFLQRSFVMIQESIEKTIDVERILRSKVGGKARFAARFLVNWLRRIVHEDEVNAFLGEHCDLEGTPWLEACVRYLDMKVTIEGIENLPRKDDGKRYIFLMFLPGLRPVCVGINKTGRNGAEMAEAVETAFESDNHIIMFPAGLNSRMIDGRVHDIPWKKTFVSKSVQYQRDVVPIYFSGRNSNRFYRIAHWQERLGLKVNIAMLFLVDEMYRNRHKSFRVVIGKPIPWQTFDRSRTPMEWAARVEDEVYQQAGPGGLKAE